MRTGLPSILLALALAVGCGSGQHDIHESYRTIQVHEARIAAAAHRTGPSARHPMTAQAAAEQACHAAQAICDTADQIQEQDATMRCSKANRACERLDSDAKSP